MYYSYPCPACGKIFYTFSEHQQTAAQILYDGIEKHMTDYNEQRKNYVLDHPGYQDVNTIYYNMTPSASIPAGGYELE